MVPVVGLPGTHQPKWINRVEFQNRNSGIAHAVKESGGCADNAHGIHNDVNRYSGTLLFYQQIGKRQADSVLVKNVGFQVDMVFGSAYGLHHRGHGFGTVVQQRKFVARNQRLAGGYFF